MTESYQPMLGLLRGMPVLCSRSLTTIKRAIFTGGAVSGICSASDRISTTCACTNSCQ